MLELNTIYNRDCLEGMKLLDNECIDLVVSSPPYDGLRDYKGYCFEFESIAIELTRTLKQGGVIVWVVGDAVINGSETCTSFKQALYFRELGLNLHDTMIYEKSGMPFPAVNRYHQMFEYMFVFSKGNPKTFNPIKDEKKIWGNQGRWGKSSERQKDGNLIETDYKPNNNEYKMRSNIWRIINAGGFGQTDKDAYKHPATFPEKLAEDHIISWSNKGDLILDPFMGSGTTAKMAFLKRRNYIGFETSKEYWELATNRLQFYKDNDQIDLYEDFINDELKKEQELKEIEIGDTQMSLLDLDELEIGVSNVRN